MREVNVHIDIEIYLEFVLNCFVLDLMTIIINY